jgi:hypothetical protein
MVEKISCFFTSHRKYNSVPQRGGSHGIVVIVIWDCKIYAMDWSGSLFDAVGEPSFCGDWISKLSLNFSACAKQQHV